MWMYIVSALLHILDGVLYFILVPFGYLSDFTTSWNGYILCHMIDKFPE